MSASSRSFRGRNLTDQDRSSNNLPENIGNRRTFEELKIPPDNVGNQENRDTIAALAHDGLGNSLDEEPSHLRSGILSQLANTKAKSNNRSTRQVPMSRMRQSAPIARVSDSDATKYRIQKEAASLDPKDLNGLSAENYMVHLTNEFTRLLRLGQGMPFSFSMKPVTDGLIDETQLRADLDSVEKLIRNILDAASVTASVFFAEYRTVNHRFAVFFVSPKEKDPIKNKDLISAVRQIVKLHSVKNPLGQTNVLLVLANAQHVIEDHLYKLGAKKIDRPL